MKKTTILLAILLPCSASIFADYGNQTVKRILAEQNNPLIKQEKEIMDSDAAYRFNVALSATSPSTYGVLNDTLKHKQLEDIKELLQKIVINQEKLLKK